jgi:hypothetical protein
LPADLDGSRCLLTACIGLKNDLECTAYHECGALRVFVVAGKPVEYTVDTRRSARRPRARVLVDAQRLALDAWRPPC